MGVYPPHFLFIIYASPYYFLYATHLSMLPYIPPIPNSYIYIITVIEEEKIIIFNIIIHINNYPPPDVQVIGERKSL